MNENTNQENNETKPERAQASEQINSVIRSLQAREINYRVWNMRSQEMIYDPYIPCTGTMNAQFVCTEGDWIWLQYIGIEDPNNKSIYEGDIIEVTDGEGWVVGTMIVKIELGFHNQLEIDERCIGKVLGNIFKNPGLLG